MGNVIRQIVSWVLRAFGVFVIAVSWLAYLGILENIGSLSLDFISEDLTMAIALTVGGAAVIAFGSSAVKLFE
ncbi:MAG: hypothetical protein PVJ61_04070 [Dehalococcoidia bacterium]|jgi:hypothetical protein